MSEERILPANPHAAYLRLKEELDAALVGVMDGQFYILGREVEAFEREFAAHAGVAHGIGVANGTDALVLALKACGIRPGDRVVTVPNTAVATVAAVELAGAEPVLVDVDPRTHLMDLDALEALLRRPPERLAAVIPVHLFGAMVDMPRLLALAAGAGLRVVEDCAQAHGASWGGRRAGSFGGAAACSFDPTEELGAFGGGGMVVTNDTDIAERVRLLRQYGWRQRYISEVAGMNSRLDELQAALLRVRLRHLDADNARRRAIASRYDEAFRDLPLERPACAPECEPVFHQYTISLDRRDDLKRHLESLGVLTSVLYPVPIHLQPAYAGRLCVPMPLQGAERAARRLLCLPMYPELREGQIERVIRGVRSFFERGA